MLLPAVAQAQHIFHGSVNNKEKQPVAYATVIWQSLPDSTIKATTMADSNGMFSFAVPASKGLLNVRAAGYKTFFKSITDTAFRYADALLQTDSKALGEVTVTASKPLLERKADRTIFNVENSIASVGSDALEALKKAPGVRVDNNDDISLAGKSSVSVMINNKLTQLSGEELAGVLQSIPSDQLSRIEIITTPPAKYDAAGNSGIINIITKKSLKNGLNGNIELGYQQNSSAAQSGNGAFNYRHNRINIYGNGNSYNGSYHPHQEYDIFFPGQQAVQRKDDRTTQIFDRFQLGADYNLSKNAVIGVLYTLGFGGPHWKEDETVVTSMYNTGTGHTDSVMRTSGHRRERGLRNVANLNYEWKMDSTGRKLSADLDYFTRTGRNSRDFVTGNEWSDGTTTGISSDNHTSGKQVIDIRSAKADVEWPTTFARYTFGAKASFIHNTSNNLFQYFNGNTYVTDTGKTNDFDYHENTQALYLSADKELSKKWQLQLGLRGEYTQTKGYSPTLNQTNTNSYFKLFPTVFVQYKPKEDHIFGFNYSRRIERPDFWIMNPFRSYTTATSYEEGNPFLQPSFSNNLELSYTLQSTYTFTVYTQQISDYFTRISKVDTLQQGISFHQANAGKIANYGLTANAVLTPFKWWECNLQLNGYYNKFSASGMAQAVSYGKAAWFAEVSNDFTLNREKTLLAELSGEYQSSQQSDYDVQRTHWTANAGIKKLMLHKQLAVALDVDDIFRTLRTRTYNQFNGTISNSYNDDRCLRFSLSWKFGNRNIQDKRTWKSSMDERAK
ncbi:TonB-dependent receptor domain-containing protein [Chitinophagaceae bacterium MMS25-I14]